MEAMKALPLGVATIGVLKSLAFGPQAAQGLLSWCSVHSHSVVSFLDGDDNGLESVVGYLDTAPRDPTRTPLIALKTGGVQSPLYPLEASMDSLISKTSGPDLAGALFLCANGVYKVTPAPIMPTSGESSDRIKERINNVCAVINFVVTARGTTHGSIPYVFRLTRDSICVLCDYEGDIGELKGAVMKELSSQFETSSEEKKTLGAITVQGFNVDPSIYASEGGHALPKTRVVEACRRALGDAYTTHGETQNLTDWAHARLQYRFAIDTRGSTEPERRTEQKVGVLVLSRGLLRVEFGIKWFSDALNTGGVGETESSSAERLFRIVKEVLETVFKDIPRTLEGNKTEMSSQVSTSALQILSSDLKAMLTDRLGASGIFDKKALDALDVKSTHTVTKGPLVTLPADN